MTPSAIAVANLKDLPPGLRFMVVRRQIRAQAVMEKLIKCSVERDCDQCRFQCQCVRLYDKRLDDIKNWRGGVRIGRFYNDLERKAK